MNKIIKQLIIFSLVLYSMMASAQDYVIDSGLNGQTINTCQGNLFDSGAFGNDYGNNENYTVTFCADNGESIVLDFTSFNTSSEDVLEIYDGSTTNNPIIGLFSGTGGLYGKVVGSNSCLTLRFQSDASSTLGGWTATVSCTNDPQGTRGISSICGYDIVVANYGNGTVTAYNSDTGSYEEVFISGLSQPNGMLIYNDTLFVANGGNSSITMYNPYTGAFYGTLITGAAGNLSFPEQLIVGPDGYLYIASQSNGMVQIVDPNTGTLIGTFVNQTAAHGVEYANDVFYVSSNISGGSVETYDINGNSLGTLFNYPTGELPRGIDMGPDGNLYVVVNIAGGTRIDVFDVDTGTRSTFATLDAGSNVYTGIQWLPDGNLYLSDFSEQEVQIYNPSGTQISVITNNVTNPHYTSISYNTPPVYCSISQTNPSCLETSDGSLTVTGVDGASPYEYSIDVGTTFQTSGVFSNLGAGSHYIVVRDSDGCTSVCGVFLDAPTCCPTITTFSDNNTGSYCYDGTPIDIVYTLGTDQGVSPGDYTVIWEVDGIEQTGTDNVLNLSLSPIDGCTPLTSPIVTVKIVCALTGDTSTVANNTSSAFVVYPTPVLGTDYAIIDNSCTVEIIDNCGTLTITNNQGGGTNYTIAEGFPDTNVAFAIKSDVNAPANCEVTENLVASCIDYDLRLSKTANSNTASVGDQIIYTIVIDNDGNGMTTNTQVIDALPNGLVYSGTYTATQGTFDGTIWTVGNMAIGQSDTIDITVTVTEMGVIINDAMALFTEQDPAGEPSVQNDSASVCISVPIELCENEASTVTIEAPMGYSSYEWFLDGVSISGATSNSYTTAVPGSYTYTADGVGSANCTGNLCCPVVIAIVECCPDKQCAPINIVKVANE